MRTKYTILVLLAWLAIGEFSAQNCGVYIVENKMLAGVQQIRTQTNVLVVRSDFSYSIEFVNTIKGVQAKAVSKGGVELNQDDEIIFMDMAGTRKAYRFVEMDNLETQSGIPVHSNMLQGTLGQPPSIGAIA